MRTATILFSTIFILFMASGCEKEEAQIWAYYDETSCSDPWQKGTNNFITQGNVVTYLDQHGIRIQSIKITEDGVSQTCGDCKCTTGRRIKVHISENDALKISDVGFHVN